MIRAGNVLSIILLSAALPAGVFAGSEEPQSGEGTSWGGEVRLHAGAINGDDAIGRTGGVLETRFFLDQHLTSRFRLFSELGSGNLEGTNEAGLHQLYFDYRLTESRDMSLAAGWIKIPFGRWDSGTLTRPLIKDRAFALGGESFFQLRRTSAGVAFHGAGGPLEGDLAVVDRRTTDDVSLRLDEGSDVMGRMGIRSGGLSVGVSALQGFGADTPVPSGPPANSSAYGLDAQWSHGLLSLTGEADVVEIAGRSNTGGYVEASYDLTRLVAGLRLTAKYDALNEVSGGPEARFHRWAVGARYSLRRDLDLEMEFDQDSVSRPVAGFGGNHFIAGIRYRF